MGVLEVARKAVCAQMVVEFSKLFYISTFLYNHLLGCFIYVYTFIWLCRGDFDLTNFKDGVLSSAFMVGLLVASPIFASLAKRYIPTTLIAR